MATSASGPRKPRKNRFEVKRGAVPPSSLVLHFSPDQWEKFIEEACWQRKLANGASYAAVKQMGGAGDGGRDVEARLVPALAAGQWDLYQAKHYSAGLKPSEFFPELAKFFLQLVAGTYPTPRQYLLCAPKGVGNDLHNLLSKPAEFKQRFLDDWAAEKTGLQGRSAELTPTVSAVTGLKVNDSVLSPRLRPGDLPGTCHHLANQGKLKWVK